jgi:Tol biopolymer transport system component
MCNSGPSEPGSQLSLRLVCGTISSMRARRGRLAALAAIGTLSLAVLVSWSGDEARAGGGSLGTIAFLRTDYRSRTHLFLMNSDGSGQRRIAVRAEAFPVWSSDGDTLAFADPGGFGGPATLDTIRSDGTGLRVVTREGEYDCLWPAWSPDGERLAFTRNDLGCDDGLALFVVNADGSGRRQVTHGGADAVWSPDGERLLYRAAGLFLLELDTGKQRRIPGARPVSSDGLPSRPPAAWSPDGQRIFYVGDDEALHVTNLDGSDDRNLTPSMDRVVSFTISPTWNEIAVAGRQGGGGREIYVLNTDGTGLRRLTDNGAIQDDDPQWSPDGRQIALVRTEPDRRSEIFVMNADGSGQTNISHHPADDAAPAWQPLTQKPTASLPHTGANLRTALIAAALLLIAGILARAASRRPVRRRGTKKQGRPGEMMMISSLCFSTSIESGGRRPKA